MILHEEDREDCSSSCTVVPLIVSFKLYLTL